MPTKTKKATFNLHIDIIAGIDEAMDRGLAPSKNALVEQALLKELKELRRQARRKAWREGATDALLLKDVEDVTAGFQTADAEAAKRIA
ncbi:MAG: hypothetical protein HYX87_07570 [Chloroflexi bacterium]|nr:hypothetical protein [Chloroflexota bacterium]